MSRCSPQDTIITTTTTSKVTTTLLLTQLPNEVQIHILSYLRSYDLGPVQRVCRFYNNIDRIHDLVTFLVHHVYGTEFCEGAIEVEDKEVDTDDSIGGVHNSVSSNNKKKLKKNISSSKKNNHRSKHPKSNDNNNTDSNAANVAVVKDDDVVEVPSPSSSSSTNTTSTTQQCRYTLTHLRSIELAVVARVLSLPEPKTGFYVSKSWIKKTLLWLELEQQKDNAEVNKKAAANNNKKLSKKQQRQKDRRLSDVTPPSTNVNSDIVCEHQNLQRSGAKAARSHRRLMDKKSWKVLRKLYPDSIQLESTHGECLQCLMEAETYQKNESDKLERDKLLRKQPLSNPHVRRFYTRTRGIPYHCLVENKDGGNEEEEQDQKPKSIIPSSSVDIERCPLTSGTYVILPRSWCHQWRRYMKTGDGCKPLPPDSSSLLCDAHKLALLPPHLEAYLNGETSQLFASVKQDAVSSSPAATTTGVPRSPVGMTQPGGRTLDAELMNALSAAGISRVDMAAQRRAMLQLEEQQHDRLQQQNQQQYEEAAIASPTTPRRRRESSSSCCNNELLDRENHAVIELVTHEELLALQQQTGCWSKQEQLSLTYSMCVTVEKNGTHGFSTLPCRECDPTGLRFTTPCASASAPIKNNILFRSKRWEPKHVEQKRIPNVEY